MLIRPDGQVHDAMVNAMSRQRPAGCVRPRE